MKDKFIKTNDEETAKKLRNAGFIEVTDSCVSYYTFVNNSSTSFDKYSIDKNKISYSNILCL